MSKQIDYYIIGKPQVIYQVFRYDGLRGNKCISNYRLKRSNGDNLKVLITTWSIDEQVDIDVFIKKDDSENTKLLDLKSLGHNKLKQTSKIHLPFNLANPFKRNDYDWLIQNFNDNDVKLLKKKNEPQCFYAEYNNRSEQQIFTIIDVFLAVKEFEFIKKPTKKSTTNFSSFFIYLFIVVFLSGCFTMVTRQRIGCRCGDGSESNATGSGACSHHDGVMFWRYEYWWDK